MAPLMLFRRRAGLAAVIDRVAKILHLQDRCIGTAGGGIHHIGLGHLGDDNVVVAEFDNLPNRQFHRRDGRIQDRAAIGAGVEVLAGQLAVLDLGRLEEGEGETLLVLAGEKEPWVTQFTVAAPTLPFPSSAVST
jgi:hypothetical protein